VRIDQNLLREFENWSVSLVVKIRQEGQANWETGLLTSDKTIEYGCDWTAAKAAPGIWKTVAEFLGEGVHHILTGKDHLLFVSALVLAATGFWDLIKVVSAFTLAHSVTLTLAVLNVVRVSEHIVEPMIAASIVFVAVQNIFWPKRSHGWERLAIAFGFGLFHGLGFAGGLKDAMEKLPSATLWAALISFSVGVELGHQVVVVPLFASLSAVRHAGAERPRLTLMRRVVTLGSIAISIGGVYFLKEALSGWGKA
jgi:hydrogenase/urease accessory protein HupE